MSKPTHTPGPWVYGDWVNKKAGFIDVDGWVDIWTYDKGEDSLPFASCRHFNELANARLIAAAPRLLAALKATKATLERVNQERGGPIVDTIWHGPGETLFDFIDAAIQEAEGEQ